MADARWTPAYVALGSNLDDPRAQVLRAFEALSALEATRLVAASRLYRSPPFGPVAQPEFVNAVAGLLTQLSPEALLTQLQELEARLGRATPQERWGPRRIDLDLLAHGSELRSTPQLQLPHPGIAERAFVLLPWADVSPALIVPGLGRVERLLQQLGARDLVALEA